ncbi:MAG: HEAT repeat domain-containing protein, partial [Polyangiaceae bacterium]
LLDRYRELLLPEAGGGIAPGDAVAVAAAWGVARMSDKQAEPLLLRLLQSTSPDIRSLAALGLGVSGNGKHAEVLADVARSPEAGPTTRAAAAHALGELGLASQRPLLLALTDSSQRDVRMAAMLALSRLGQAPDADDVGQLLARALLGEEASLRRTAMAAATALATGTYQRGPTAFPVPDGVVDVNHVLEGLTPSGYSHAAQARALVGLREPLTKAALAAVATSPERARIVAELTMTGLMPLLEATDDDPLPGPLKQQLADTTEAIAKASVTGFVALSRHPSEGVRKRAVEFLARRSEPQARAAVVSALTEDDPGVSKAALSAIGDARDPETVAAVIGLATKARSWSLRAHAARALGSVALQGDQQSAAEAALRRAAESDDYALVREAALRGAVARGGSFARTLLSDAASRDPEPRLVTLARELLAELEGAPPAPSPEKAR